MKALVALFLAMMVASFASQSVAYWWPSQVWRRYFGSSDQSTLPSATAVLYEANGVLQTTTVAPENATAMTLNQEVTASSVTSALSANETLVVDPGSGHLHDDNLVFDTVVNTGVTSQETTFTPEATTREQPTKMVTTSATPVFTSTEKFVSASDTDFPDDGAFKPQAEEDLSVSKMTTEPTPSIEPMTTSSSPSLQKPVQATVPPTTSGFTGSTTSPVSNEAHSDTDTVAAGQPATSPSIGDVRDTALSPASEFMDYTNTSVPVNEVRSDAKMTAVGQLTTTPSIGAVETTSPPFYVTTSDDVEYLADVSSFVAEAHTDVPMVYTVSYAPDASSPSNTVTTYRAVAGSTAFFLLASDGTMHTRTDGYTAATTENLTFAGDMATLTAVDVAATALPQSPTASNDIEDTAVRSTHYNSSTTIANGEDLSVTEPEAEPTAFATVLSVTRPRTTSAEDPGQVLPETTTTTAISVKTHISSTASPSSGATKPDNIKPSEESDVSSPPNTVTTDGAVTGSTAFFLLASDGTIRTPTDDYIVATTENLTFASDMATLTAVDIGASALPQPLTTSNGIEVTAFRSPQYNSSTTIANGEGPSVTEPEAHSTTFATVSSVTHHGTTSAEDLAQVLPATTAPTTTSVKMYISTTASPSSGTTKPDSVKPSEENVDLDATTVMQQAPISSSLPSPPSGLSHSTYMEDYGTTTTTATTRATRRYKPVHVRRFTPWIITRSPSSTPVVTADSSASTSAVSTVVRPQGERDALETQQPSTMESTSKPGVAPVHETREPNVVHGASVSSTRRITKRPPSDTLVVPESFFATRALFNRFGRPYCPGCDALLIKLPDRFSLPRLPSYVYG